MIISRLKDGRPSHQVEAAVLVATILAINATRLDGMIALVAAAAVAAYLWRTWVRRGRPRGVATAGAG